MGAPLLLANSKTLSACDNIVVNYGHHLHCILSNLLYIHGAFLFVLCGHLSTAFLFSEICYKQECDSTHNLNVYLEHMNLVISHMYH